MFPVVPESSKKIWKNLNLPGDVEKQSWDSAADALIPAGHRIGTPEILFTKIEDDVIQKELDSLPKSDVGAPGQPAPASQAPSKPTITLDDFKKIDLRVAKVVSAESVPRSEKLLKLHVEVGAEKRQIIAGIAQHYKPEELVGKSVVMVFNLQPAKLMGQESQGMLLAASGSDGKLVILQPAAEISSGSAVK